MSNIVGLDGQAISKAKLPHTNDLAVVMLRRAYAAQDDGHYAEADQLFVAAFYPRFGHLMERASVEEATAELMTSDDRERILTRAL
jgi:hypothetical protein